MIHAKMTPSLRTLIFGILLLACPAVYAQMVAAAGNVACTQAAEVRENRCQMAATAELIAARNVTAVLGLGDLQLSAGQLRRLYGRLRRVLGTV